MSDVDETVAPMERIHIATVAFDKMTPTVVDCVNREIEAFYAEWRRSHPAEDKK